MQDVNCGSLYMLQVMPKVADSIRAEFPWIPFGEIIHLVIDITGGYDTDDAKKEYEEMLGSYNTQVIWQVIKSLETNMLNLGI